MRSPLTPDAEQRLFKAVESGLDGSLVRERFGLTESQVTNLLFRLRRQRRNQSQDLKTGIFPSHSREAGRRT